ncbi:hybrid sensor histidine kinase/response regulator [Oceanispirochaeta crateris]|uniref:hybrid sensor histidine kinase/response regulator n=1 Tax=Oceanispirochaeta crateris TaxID=2518645 RepID=UPI00143CE4AA|nr:PAS domain-containing sensor histidine kinase [Oceanispirochaeta crateris]
MIDSKFYNFLIRPEIVFIPKSINLVAAITVIVILIRKWIPQESRRLNRIINKMSNSELIIDQIPISIVITDLDGNIEFANDKFVTLTGYTLDEVMGENPRILKGSEATITDYEELWTTVVNGDKWTGVFYNKKKNGEYYWEDAIITPLSDEDGNIVNYLAIKEDITEKVLQDNEIEMLLSAIEQSSDSVEILDIEGNLQYVNNTFTKRTGYTKEEVIGKNPLDLFSSDKTDNRAVYDELWDTLHSGNAWIGRFTNKNKDGSFIVEEVSVSPVLDQFGKVRSYSSVKRNITKQIQLEEEHRQIKDQLYHSQKLEAVGQLAGGVAHDFNNILNGVISAVTLLENKETDLDAQSQSYLNMIMTSTKRASVLASNLLTVSRRGRSECVYFHIKDILLETTSILEISVNNKIRITTRFNAHNDMVHADQSGFQNVLLNLGLNASHAINSQYGTIDFIVSNIFLDEVYCSTSSFVIEPGEYCKIIVKDSGTGIDDDILPNIFDAFFTTKIDGKGTGLGLSSTMRYIQDHGGEITVTSRIGHGTEFCILLPCSDDTKDLETKADRSVPSGSETILLVDDEDFNRDLGRDILESIGYQVIVAADGMEAVQIFSENQDRIDLVVLDMVMPGMDGSAAFMKIKEIDSEAKIIITSGYLEAEKIENLRAHGLEFMISKPYEIAEFSQLIRNILK